MANVSVEIAAAGDAADDASSGPPSLCANSDESDDSSTPRADLGPTSLGSATRRPRTITRFAALEAVAAEPPLVSNSPASTPRGGTADTAAFWMTGDGAVIHGGTRLAACLAVVDADAAVDSVEHPPQPQPHAPSQPEDLEAQDEPQLQTQAQATAGAAIASIAGEVASAGAAAAAGAGAVAGTAAGPAAGTVAGAGAATAAGAGGGVGADYRTWVLNRKNVEVWYDENVQRWRDRRGRFAKGPR